MSTKKEKATEIEGYPIREPYIEHPMINPNLHNKEINE